MESTLFFNNLTCIDHALIDNHGRIVGGSYHINVSVTGKVTDDESVVIDFSHGKKVIKSIIDDKNGVIGLDHKLWVIKGYSVCELNYINETHCAIHTNLETYMELPISDIHFIDNPSNDDNIIKIVQNDIKKILEKILSQNYNLDVDVAVELTQDNFAKNKSNYIPFRYVHGLKNSTAYGCQNIAHGHLSWFEILETEPEYQEDCPDCQIGRQKIQEFINELSDCIFINKENILSDDEFYIVLKYTTGRGVMFMKLNKQNQKYVILETETTIEYIADYVHNSLNHWLLLSKTNSFAISEGLQKGVLKKS